MYTVNSLEHQWIPFTNNREFKANPRLMVKGEGVYYTNHHGDRVLDGSSGLFCCALGHGRPEIAEAVYAQLKEMEYSPPFGVNHPGSFELAQRLTRILPEGLNRVFFTSSGSESIDTAMKIALAYHHAKGEGQRTKFISRERGYHGVNFGGTSLQGLVKNRDAFGPLLPGVAHIRHTWDPEQTFTRGQPERGAELAEDLNRMVALFGAQTIAACVVEPIAGSTGCLVPPKGYLERLRQICDQHGILLIFDEVICGFGRTGKAFASQSFGVTPDIMTLAKALTNAAQPMGAVACAEFIYDTIIEAAPEHAIELFHGYTFSGHPAACAAGIATLEIYEREDLFAKGAALSPYFQDAVFSLQDVPAITDIRGYGMMAGIDVKPAAVPGARGPKVQVALFNKGLHIKATGDALIVAPPLVAEKQHIDELVGILRDVLTTEFAD